MPPGLKNSAKSGSGTSGPAADIGYLPASLLWNAATTTCCHLALTSGGRWTLPGSMDATTPGEGLMTTPPSTGGSGIAPIADSMRSGSHSTWTEALFPALPRWLSSSDWAVARNWSTMLASVADTLMKISL